MQSYSRSFTPKYGLLEILAALHRVRWKDASGQRHAEKIYCMPVAIEKGNASTIWTALETATPEMSLSRICEIASKVKMLIVHEVPDSCRANKRVMGFRSVNLPVNALHSKLPCCGHILHLIITDAPRGTKLHEDDVVGDVYASEYVGRCPTLRNKMMLALRTFLSHPDQGLRVIDDGRQPRAEDRQHLEGVLRCTIRRRLEMDAGPSESTINDLCERVGLVFNGDLRLPYPVHIKVLQTEHMDRNDLIEFALTVVRDAKLIPGMGSQMPSKIKWGSMLQALERQCAGSQAIIASGIRRELNLICIWI